MYPIATYVFLDFGTTDKEDLKSAEITELAMVAVNREHLLHTPPSRTTPRVQKKLILCFKVEKDMSYEARSDGNGGFTKDDLKDESSFDGTTFRTIDNFLNTLKKPVCLLAHYGRIFDFPLLKRYLKELNMRFTDTKLMCADTHLTFYDIETQRIIPRLDPRSLSPSSDDDDLLAENTIAMQSVNETTPRKKQRIEVPNTTRPHAKARQYPWGAQSNMPKETYELKEVYNRVMRKKPDDAHKAEVDCILMLEIAVKLGQKFVEWTDDYNNLLCFATPDHIKDV